MSLGKMDRTNRLIAAAKEQDLDWVLCMLPENIFYFSGFRTMLYTRFVGVLAPVKEQREPVLIASYIDRRLIEEDIWSPHWFKETVLWGPGPGYEQQTPWDALKLYLGPGIRLGVDAIQYDFYKQLEENFPGIEVIDCQEDILQLRMVKDEGEVAKVAAAYKMAMGIMARVPDWLSQPMTEAELAAKITAQATREGADGVLFPTLVSCGPKMLAYHSPPLPRPIESGQLLRVACGPMLDGYGADIIRSFCIGDPPAEVLPLKDAFYEAQGAVIDMLRPGANAADLLAKVREVYDRRGVLGNWGSNIGHGLALTIHEPPRIAGADRTVIKENMILAIEPSLGCPPHGAFAHCDGVRVTADGCERLSGGMMDLIVV